MSSSAWQAFHASHFDDAARRAWFAGHLAYGHAPLIPSAPLGRLEQEDAWTQLAPGEHDVDWQRRHGVQYLTPGSARIFDASRRFREGRWRADEARAKDEARTSQAPERRSPDPPCPEELAALRARALEAMSKRRTAGA